MIREKILQEVCMLRVSGLPCTKQKKKKNLSKYA